ncbi:hypothetical protein K2X30_13150 [bacterium]|nr:hypothetical protein [bacterium]
MQLAKSLSPFSISHPNLLNEVTIKHDAFVTTARIKLCQFWDGQFIPEMALQRSSRNEIPDGLFIFPSGREVVLEVENSDKGKSRFCRLLNRWQDQPNTWLVLYVASNDSLYQILQRYLLGLKQKKAVGLILESELRNNESKIWTPWGLSQPFLKRVC